MDKKLLQREIKKVISEQIHIAKCNANKEKEIPKEIWMKIMGDEIAEICFPKIQMLIEAWAYLPCCHTTGMHNPNQFEKKSYICESQKAEAFERLCSSFGINPVTRSKPDCYWCREYLHYRIGEGVPLFKNEGENSNE